MTILSGLANVQAPPTAGTARTRPSTPVQALPETARTARAAAEASRRDAPPGSERPQAVSSSHRVERPIPCDTCGPPARGSIVDVTV